MRDGERFAIHFVGKQRVAVERFLDGQAANEIGCASYSAIRTVEPEVTRCWLDAHGGEKVGQPNIAYFQPIGEILSVYGLTLKTS